MLAVEGLRFAYRKGGSELFGGLNHQFRAGGVTALTGPSGRGKSTLLYLLGLLLTPAAGVVRLGGDDVSRLPDRHRSRIRAREIGFVFQDSELDPTRPVIDSVLEPSVYAGSNPAEARDRGYELLERFGLGERSDHRPGQISGGQAQRVAICRALINNPAILLADEPTGNLDPATGERVLAALAEVAEKHTVIIATHDPAVVAAADEVVRL
ncbi:ABC transporter ATP-binding protein [Tessaracoccus sp. OH4464_COT-324]|uniref:ABC transporter ATP-binding protein n=1 Tax=Tessaracoccus sp. OH4464_COT-324 TaxID=2491059 RepID=UPI000F63B281|nr:ATP-binding cassette domain-containing protein [Tessaracoccus sp. OH4464_COT-324]RRD45663.1 ATP-binding cassette domain-containing protein [Tessaracoccus sp. OH4464_COT-324]